jgi:hypothetical protein
MVLDPKLPEGSAIPWLTYLGARSAYREQHKLSSPSSGEITPTFAEEVSARQAAVEFYSAMKAAGQTDPYWEAIAKVNAAGFMKEYAWVYLRRKEWPNSETPRKLTTFQNWTRVNLPNHKPQTRGILTTQRK